MISGDASARHILDLFHSESVSIHGGDRGREHRAQAQLNMMMRKSPKARFELTDRALFLFLYRYFPRCLMPSPL